MGLRLEAMKWREVLDVHPSSVLEMLLDCWSEAGFEFTKPGKRSWR